MVQIQNTDAITAIRDAARLSISEGFPQHLDLKVVPVMDMTPDFHRFTNIIQQVTSTVTGASDIYVVSTAKTLYLTNVTLGFSKDAACNIATGVISITGTVDGRLKNLISIPVFTLVVERDMVSIALVKPIKLDGGSTITSNVTFSLGAMVRSGAIMGYEVPN